MPRRTALTLCLVLATLLVVARTVPFMAPGVRFDADQAVVGLMAKHISEGRAFPLFFYGQSYLLAVEAYLAAPVMWLLGPTEVALKLPLLAMNVATVLLLVWRAHRDLGLAPWALALTVAGLVCGALSMRRQAPARHAGIPGTALPGYLVAVGVLSTLVYGFVACSQLSQATLRYELLLLFLPAGALLAGLRWPVPAARAGLVTAALLWAGLNLSDYLALAGEIRSGRWPDRRGEAMRALEARGFDTLWGDYRLAYVLSFRSQERLKVAALTVHRVDEYARLAAARDVPLVKQGLCADGTEFVPGIWLCPPPAPAERPPVY